MTGQDAGRSGGGLYELLGLPSGAPDEQIRSAVTEQRRTWRRRTASADITVRQQAELRMQQLDEAERTLLDPALRHTYDLAAEPVPEPDPGDQQWLVRAVEQLDRQQYEVATFTARRAVAADPDNFYAWSVLGEAAARSGEHDTAREAIEHSLSLRPEDPKLHAMRGWILVTCGDLPRAVSAYRTAAKLDPADPDHRVRAVRALVKQGLLDAAITEAEAAYQASPDDPETRTALADALLERANEARHELPDGRLLIVSRAQAAHVESLCNRGLSVQSSDEKLNADLRSVRDLARKAGRRVFSAHAIRDNLRWPLGMGLLTVAVVCCAPNFLSGAGKSGAGAESAYVAIAVLMVAAAVTTVYLTCTEPRYQRNAEVIEHQVPRRLGRGPGTPDRP
ncbi:MAG: hypothetical protein QOJ50_763 [Cryptosporangiaceae bacterium]|nr:hypothetical protein [Cryptosporangiaceae bacterium]